jgi:DNA (cytosine-5)-methyltransferase 1
MRAIDLYSGVGGWSLGLGLAGVQVTDSYERWSAANETNRQNNCHRVHDVDIRTLELAGLPDDIDLIVGSPPCTEFSFANRGGNGDISDGLQDIRKFFEIVDHVRPRVWVMENVPRCKDIILSELRPGGVLAEFAHLKPEARVFRLEEFGLPQRRRRCLIGNLDFNLLETYATSLPRTTLRDVMAAYSAGDAKDPLYGVIVSDDRLFDHDPDDYLNWEELRINRSLKVKHPVYNAMAFPDPPERAVRTLTATCTRVSRESVVVADDEGFRRLTVRERASLQGFPTTYQFYAPSHGQKLKMIGNALPPLFAYYVGCAAKEVARESLKPLDAAITSWTGPSEAPPQTKTDRPAFTFRKNRPFRFAIPSLHFKSGVRFELTNRCTPFGWAVEFKFGTPKNILSLELSAKLRDEIRTHEALANEPMISRHIQALEAYLASVDCSTLQRVWSHRGPGSTHPFVLLDKISALAEDMGVDISETVHAAMLEGLIIDCFGPMWTTVPGKAKILRNASRVVAGLIVGSTANAMFELQPANGAELRSTEAPSADRRKASLA